LAPKGHKISEPLLYHFLGHFRISKLADGNDRNINNLFYGCR